DFLKLTDSPQLFDSSVEKVPYSESIDLSEDVIILGAYLDTNGNLVEHSTYFVSHFISLPHDLGNQFTSRTSRTTSGEVQYSLRFVAVFDASRNQIIGSGSTALSNGFNTGYPIVRFTGFLADLETTEVVNGTSFPSEEYTPGGKIIDSDFSTTTEQISQSGDARYFKKTDKIPADNAEFIITTENDLDLATITRDRYVVGSTGALATPSGGTPIDRYFATGFIQRKSGATHIRLSYGHQIAFYTTASQTTYTTGSSLNAYNALVAWPAGAQFFRVGILTSIIDSAMVVQGDSSVALPDTYQPHKVLDGVSVVGLSEKAEKDEILLLNIPEICIAVGR